MSGIVITQVTRPEAIFEFDPAKKMERVKIDYDSATVVAERLKQSGGLVTRILAQLPLQIHQY